MLSFMFYTELMEPKDKQFKEHESKDHRKHDFSEGPNCMDCGIHMDSTDAHAAEGHAHSQQKGE